ncbi:MAG: very short patch repair endonuclease, partial [Spirochaetales bacterium]|nr:very short patch repair endonuclease [Spirochaetales bacterium]
HEGCSRFRMPGSNIGFWEAKIKRNRERDERVTAELESMGWRVIVVWECEIDRKSYRQENLERIYHELISG